MKACIKLIISVAVGILLSGCGGDAASGSAPDAVVAVGPDVLTLRDLRSQIPAGLSTEDSTKYARAYIRHWVDNRLLLQVASTQIDMTEIDRLTEDYRLELISADYRRKMAARADNATFADDSLRAYYDAHQSEFKLERPLVKGVYLKVPDDASALRQLRRLYRSERPADIDMLEKAASSAAIHYDYFRDRWVDWEQIETRIPVAFAESPASFLASHKPLDVSTGGFTYLLYITESLPAGATMPFDAAKPYVRERMISALRQRLDNELRNELYQRAVDDGTVRMF